MGFPPISQRGGHLGVAEDTRLLGEGQVGGDDDRGTLVKPADQMKEQLAAGFVRAGQAKVPEKQLRKSPGHCQLKLPWYALRVGGERLGIWERKACLLPLYRNRATGRKAL